MKQLWERHKADIGLAVLIAYTLSLGVATADEIFHLGIFPTKLERLIAKDIDKFDHPDPRKRDEAMRHLLQYGDFAVPQLVGALDRGPKIRDRAMEALRKITDLDFESPEKWKNWHRLNKDEFYP